ncbi:MAG: tripartite tricarboxylate transporter TctB family protein [Aquisalimonadaceae bacterium]
MDVRRLDILYGAVFLAGAAFLYWIAVETGITARRIASDPMWYPKVLLVLMLLCSGWLIVRGVLSRQRDHVGGLEWRRLAVTLVLSTLSLLFFARLGFVLMSLILVPVLSWSLGYRRPWPVVLTTVGFTAVVWCGFTYGLGITPPAPDFIYLSR